MRFRVEISTPSLPERRPLRVLFVMVMVVALTVPATVLASHLFPDVPDSNAFHGNISNLALSGVTAGCGDGNFCPSEAVTREQMAAFLTRAMGRVSLKDLNDSAVPTSETPAVWTFQITPGTPNGALAAARQFIKAEADITVYLTDATGCPCQYRAALYLTGVGYMVERYADVTLDTVDQKVSISMNGAIAVAGSSAKTVEVRIRRLSGSGTATAYGNATAELFPLGSTGSNVLVAPAALTPDSSGTSTR